MFTESKEKRMFVSEETFVIRYSSFSYISLDSEFGLMVSRNGDGWIIEDARDNDHDLFPLHKNGGCYGTREQAETAAILFATIWNQRIIIF